MDTTANPSSSTTTNAPAMRLERATGWDVFAIHRLERAAFGRDAYDVLALLELLLSSHMRCLKVVMDGQGKQRQIVGFVAGEWHQRQHAGWIVTLGVHPDYAGHGIGTRLLLGCEAVLKMPLMKLTVRKSNQRAIQLYERHGYQFVHTIAHYYSDREDGLLMEKTVL